MPAETMERKAFRSLNGIEISSLLLDRQRQSRAVRAAGRRRLIPEAKVVSLYDDLYSTIRGGGWRSEVGRKEEDESVGQASNRHRAEAGRFTGA